MVEAIKTASNLLSFKASNGLSIGFDLRIFDTREDKSSFYVHNSYRKNIGKIISFLKYL